MVRRARWSVGWLAAWLGLAAGSALGAAPEPRVWQTQTFALRAGWSAIFSHVDTRHTTLDELALANVDIEEIWRWSPEFANLRFLEGPDQPAESPANWLVWKRADANSTLKWLEGNAAYLVKLRTGSALLQWSVKGVPVPVHYNWKSDGMNLVGFSTVPVNPPTLEQFLSPVPRLLVNTPIYQYRGGDLGSGNPLQLISFRGVPARRGEAFWVRAGDSARYYGPVEFEVQNLKGLHFGDQLSRYRVTLRNVASQYVTVQGQLVDSEPPPPGQESILGVPTLLIRGALNPTSGVFAAESLGTGATKSWNLAPRDQPGSEVSLVLGIHWAQLAGSPGALNGAVLRLSDDLGHVQFDLPVTARVPDASGLWVGEATVSQVQQELKSFRKASNQGTVKARVTGDVSLVWVKRLPEARTPADADDTDQWQEVAGLYFRKAFRSYVGVAAGTVLAPPSEDENGEGLTDPAFYWQARPWDSSFTLGYYFDVARQAVVGSGYRDGVRIVWSKAAGVLNPPLGTYPAQQEAAYERAMEGQILAPPSHADLEVLPGYWQPRPQGAPDQAPFAYSDLDQSVTSLIDGDVTVIWLKGQAEATAPVDAGDQGKWFLRDDRYYRRFSKTYAGQAVGAVLAPPATDENGAAVADPQTYWQSRPYHPTFVLGYEYRPGTQLTVANGLVTAMDLVWLPTGTSDPAQGTTRSYAGVVAGMVLLPPPRVAVPVAATHWNAVPDGALDRPAFTFEPSGEQYEITPEGKYVQTSENQQMAGVAKSMPLRLIFHSAPTSPGQYAVRLLQRVYFSTDADARVVLANNPQWISSNTAPIRRISSAHVPWSEANAPVACVGDLQFGVAGQLVTSHADGIANPFVHAYHPDHDNLDARFEQPVAQGAESFGIRRSFTLTPAADESNFDSLARGGDTRIGTYEEVLQLEGQGGFRKEYRMRGGYLLRRIVKTPTLLTQ